MSSADAEKKDVEQKPSPERATEDIARIIVYFLSTVGIILVLGLISFILLDKKIPDAYVPVLATIIGTMAGALIPQFSKK